MSKRDLVQEAAANAKSLQLDEIHSKIDPFYDKMSFKPTN